MSIESLAVHQTIALDPQKIPRHLAIMMDGNRRWAVKHGKKLIEGHIQGAETLTEIVRAASNLGVRYLTVYSFSTENWTRPQEEVNGLMGLFQLYLLKQKKMMIDEGVRLEAIGDLGRLPKGVFDTYQEVKEATKNGENITLVLALNYGARDELVRSVKKMVTDIVDKKIQIDSLNEELFSSYLDTKPYGDPDLLIRTSGEMRLSNFLLWQLSYTELIITDTLWPDFTEESLVKAIGEYQRRQKRGGA